MVISIGAIISFLIIDIGNLKVEEFKADSIKNEMRKTRIKGLFRIYRNGEKVQIDTHWYGKDA